MTAPQSPPTSIPTVTLRRATQRRRAPRTRLHLERRVGDRWDVAGCTDRVDPDPDSLAVKVS